MTAFWLLGAALAVGVLAWVLHPLLGARKSGPLSRDAANVAIYRDQMRELDSDRAAGLLAQEDFDRARAELEARLLQDVGGVEKKAASTGRWSALAAGVALPVIAVAVYFLVGTPQAIDREGQVEALVARLAERMRASPEDPEGWKLLGRTYAAMGRYEAAVGAYGEAAKRAPRDAQLLADFADVLAMARGRSLQGEPEKLVQRALELEPDNLKALALAGSAAFERRDFARAAALWQRMLPLVPADSEDARMVQQNVAEARALAGEGVDHAGVRGTVSLSPKLKDKVQPDDTVFVFARAAEGPPMPLAAARIRVRDLPYKFRLDDSMAMSPAHKLSSVPKVVVTARISKSGNAAVQAGDLEGASTPVPNDADAVRVVIDRVR